MRDCLFPAGLRNCEALHGLLHQKFACNNFLIGGSWTTVTMVQVLNLIQCLLNIMNELIDIESSYPDLAKFLLYTLFQKLHPLFFTIPYSHAPMSIIFGNNV